MEDKGEEFHGFKSVEEFSQVSHAVRFDRWNICSDFMLRDAAGN